MLPRAETTGNTPDWLVKRRRLDAILRMQAAILMGEPATQDAVRVLADALSDSDIEVREVAAAALADFGPDAELALPKLLTAAGDESSLVRRRAVRALGCLGSCEDALPALVAATDDPDPGVSLQAAATLGDLGAAAAPAVPALMALLWTGDVRVRAVIGVALARIGEAAVPALAQSLRHPSVDVRLKATQILAKIGPEANLAIPALEHLTRSSDPTLRDAAVDALQHIRQSPLSHQI